MADITLRESTEEDIPVFFRQQLDPESQFMAAFTIKDPTDEEAFTTRWKKILAGETLIKRTILVDGNVAGHVVSFGRSDETEVTYWLGREYWNQGIATAALALFLREVPIRPIHARTAADHRASIRILEKCGFEQTGTDTCFSNARGEDIDELLFTLA